MPVDNPAKIHTLFRDAFNAGDIESLVALYESSAVLVVDGQPVVGRQAIRIAFEGFLSRRARMTLKTRSVIKSEEGLAVLHGDWVLEPALADEIGTTTRGMSTEVIRRQPDGTWRFVIDNPHTPQIRELPRR